MYLSQSFTVKSYIKWSQITKTYKMKHEEELQVVFQE